MRGPRLVLLLLALLAARAADGLSLYPDRSGRDHLAALDEREAWRPRLRLSRWQPYGLPGVALSGLALAHGGPRLRGELELIREDWDLLAAWRLRGRLLARAGAVARLGLDWERQALDGRPGEQEAHLLVAVAAPVGLVLRLGLARWPTGAPAAPPSLFGLNLRGVNWGLRLWREEAAEGVSLSWRRGGLELELIALAPGWQGLALRFGASGWRLVVEERRHPWLGGSHGLRLELG